MLQLSLAMHRRNPGYEVKAIISFHKGGEKQDEAKANLKNMQDSLEKTIPRSLKPKYKISPDDLVVLVKVDKASAAQSTMRKMEDFIQSSATALHLK